MGRRIESLSQVALMRPVDYTISNDSADNDSGLWLSHDRCNKKLYVSIC